MARVAALDNRQATHIECRKVAQRILQRLVGENGDDVARADVADDAGAPACRHGTFEVGQRNNAKQGTVLIEDDEAVVAGFLEARGQVDQIHVRRCKLQGGSRRHGVLGDDCLHQVDVAAQSDLAAAALQLRRVDVGHAEDPRRQRGSERCHEQGRRQVVVLRHLEDEQHGRHRRVQRRRQHRRHADQRVLPSPGHCQAGRQHVCRLSVCSAQHGADEQHGGDDAACAARPQR